MKRGNEFVHEVWVRSAVALERPGISDKMGMSAIWIRSFATGEVLIFRQIQKGLGGEMANGFRQEFGIVRRSDMLHALSLCPLRGMQDEAFPLDQWPLQ